MDEKHSSKWVIAATSSALVLLLAIGAVFALRDQLFAQTRADAAKAVAERDKLASRIAALESNPAPSNAPTDSVLAEQLAASTSKLEELNKRLEAIETTSQDKKADVEVAVTAAPAPPPPPAPVVEPAHAPSTTADSGPLLIAAVISGKAYEEELVTWQKDHPKALETALALQPFAEKGIPTEQELTESLRSILESIPASESEAPGSVVTKINTHLEGLVSIKKTNKDPYVKLRAHALSESYTNLLHEIDQLPEAQRKPFIEWRDTARARAAAIAALPTIAMEGQ